MRIATARRVPGPGAATALLLAVAAGPAGAEPPAYAFPDRSDRTVSYDMKIRLDPETHLVTGVQTITWRNDSDEDVPSLWLHLYLNAFAHDRTTLAREGGLRVSRKWLAETREYWGYCHLEELRLADGRDLLPTLEHRQPDDANPDDRTVARVLLPEPVSPGESVTLETRFVSRLPHARRRSGHAGNFHFAAQWFPKLGVYQGVARHPETEGWSCHQYHAHTEFFADHGTYRVELTVPPAYGGEQGGRVGATGVLRSERRHGEDSGSAAWPYHEGEWSYLYEQQDVHDFAWTADPDYLVEERTYVHEERRTDAVVAEEDFLATEVGVPRAQLALPDVRVRLLLQPDHAALAERHFEAAFQAITWYGLWFGPYPYETLTIVDPQFDGRAVSGMEYPTLITAGTSWRSPPTRLSPEHVTVHEFGHQYFYGLIGNDEVAEAWLDEGFNSYADDKVLDRGWGGRIRHASFAHGQLPVQSVLGLPSGDTPSDPRSLLAFQAFGRRPGSLADRWFQHVGATWDRSQPVPDPLDSRGTVAVHGAKDRVDTVAFATLDRGSYRSIAYAKPALLLTQLERTVGRARFLSALREYCARYRHGHPDGSDFLEVFEEVTGHPAADVRQLMRAEDLDYAVGEISSTPIKPLKGLIPGPSGFHLTTHEPEGKARKHRSVVKVRRLGGLVAPVTIAVGLEGVAEPEIFEWDGEARWHRIELVREQKVTSVTVDPEYVHVLDRNRLNNHWTSEKDHRPAVSWAARVLLLVQSSLLGTRGLS